MTTFGATGCSPAARDPFASRDGAAEATADAASGKSLKIYIAAQNGVALNWTVPGLPDCVPKPSASGTFVSVPEAGFQEGENMTPDDMRRRSSAYAFASAYNRATFRLRIPLVRKACPEASALGA